MNASANVRDGSFTSADAAVTPFLTRPPWKIHVLRSTLFRPHTALALAVLLGGCSSGVDDPTLSSSSEAPGSSVDLADPYLNAQAIVFDDPIAQAIFVTDIAHTPPVKADAGWVLQATLTNHSRIPTVALDIEASLCVKHDCARRLTRVSFDPPLPPGGSSAWFTRMDAPAGAMVDTLTPGVTVKHWVTAEELQSPWRPLSAAANAQVQASP